MLFTLKLTAAVEKCKFKYVMFGTPLGNKSLFQSLFPQMLTLTHRKLIKQLQHTRQYTIWCPVGARKLCDISIFHNTTPCMHHTQISLNCIWCVLGMVRI